MRRAVNPGDHELAATADGFADNRVSFTVGAALAFIAVVIGGWFDVLMSRFVDLIMAIPGLIFALVILSVVPVSILILIMVGIVMVIILATLVPLLQITSSLG